MKYAVNVSISARPYSWPNHMLGFMVERIVMILAKHTEIH
jgi:hypothetical protein